MTSNIKEELIFDGRTVTLEWIVSNTIPANIQISQVTVFCMNDNHNVLLVKNKRGWGFPGGHPEAGESPLETMDRELKEEASATAHDPVLIGYMEVHDPDNVSIEGKHYIQLRYLAFLDELDNFDAAFETDDRKLVLLDELADYVSWIHSPTGSAQIGALKDVLQKS